MKHIAICIATFKRDDGLSDLLESITKLQVDDDCSLRVIVVDNFGEGAAKQVCSSWKPHGRFEIDYYIESRKGVAHVRNKALEQLPEEVQFVSFLDDDETVSEQWLDQMLKGIEKYDADICNGPVFPIFPEHTPAWIRRGKFLDRDISMATGEVKIDANAGNAFFKKSILREFSTWFDPAFGLSGGEDTDFFRRLHLSGKLIVWVGEAAVYEPVDDVRLSGRWILKRIFQGANIGHRVNLKNDSSVKCKLMITVKSLIRLAQFFIGIWFLPLAVIRKEWGVKICAYLMIAAAGAYALRGKNLQAYGQG